MIKRHIISQVKQSLANFPAVLLIGARQVGKSTLAKQLIDESLIRQYITMDELIYLTGAIEDPEGFIMQYSEPVALDEIQRAPQLLVAIKRSIDQNRKPGQFLLTGSANVLAYPNVTESLAGRMDIIQLEGLSLSELALSPHPTTFITDLLSGKSVPELIAKWQKLLLGKPTLTREEIGKKIFYGGFPEVVLKQNPDFTIRWFHAYLTTYVERDVRDIRHYLDIVGFSKFFKLIGLQTANLLNVKNVANEINLDQRTVRRYIEILQISFQANELSPWYANTRKRLLKTPKIFMNDSGFACHLAGIQHPDELLRHSALGNLFETWVWAELRKLLSHSPMITTSFYRTHQGKEVDFILSKGDKHCGIECKFKPSVTLKDLQGLKDFQENLSENGPHIILYAGDELTQVSHNILAVPIKILI